MAAGWLSSVFLRSSFGRPRFLAGRLGVEDSEAEAGDEGDSRVSICGLCEGETACCGVSPLCDEGWDAPAIVVVVVVGEKQSGSPFCGGVGCIEKLA